MRAALRAQDRVALAALRPTVAAIDNAAAQRSSPTGGERSDLIAGATKGLGATEVPRRVLDEEEITALVRAEVGDRLAAADELVRLGRDDRAAALRAEARVLRAILATS